MRCSLLMLMLLIPSVALGQANKRETQVRNDRTAFEHSKEWIYNDLEAGLREGKKTGKPVLVVFRCVPCEACHDFDEDVADRDPVVRDLMDQFVCVRIVYGNSIDLNRFQYDFDQSFAVVLMNADGTLYGRFGTRSGRKESEDISLEGLRNALGGALKMHREFDKYRPLLAGKQVKPGPYATPRDYPMLKGKYAAKLDYEGQVVKSCIHCHQIGEAQRHAFYAKGEPVPDSVLFPYPDPSTLGLSMNPKAAATVRTVAKDSLAAQAGIQAGDAIVSLAGQPLLSIADIQWVLHQSPDQGELVAELMRGDQKLNASIPLPSGWRRGDLSWRPTTWDLRRRALGGMKLDPLPDSERKKLGLAPDALALLIKHVGQYGDHAVAYRAGVRGGDVLVGYQTLEGPKTETDLIAYALQQMPPGQTVEITVLHQGQKKVMKFKLP